MPREKKPAAIAMPILALRGLMVFPHMVLHFDVGREKSVAALEQAMMESQEIFLVAQRDADVEDPTVDQLCRVGTIAHIKQVLNLPGDSLRVLVEGLRRATLETITQEEPYLLGKVRPSLSARRKKALRCRRWYAPPRTFLPPMPRPANGFLLKP